MDVSGTIDFEKTQPRSDRPAKASGSRKSFAKRRIRVVIADDEPLIRDQIGSLLETRYEVIDRVCNGRELVDAVQRSAPAVVVTDIAMPIMNGIEAARLIRGTYPEVKVVILSVYSDRAFVDSAFEAGASGYVVKVSASTELIPAIDDVLAGREYRPGDSL